MTNVCVCVCVCRKPSCVKRGTEYEVPWFQRRGYYIHKPASHGFAPLSQRISTAELITDASSPQSRVANMLKNPKFQPSNGTQTHSVQHLQLLWRLVYTTHHWVSKEGSAGYVVLSALNSFPHSCAPSCVLQYTDGTLRLIKMQSCTLDTVTINHCMPNFQFSQEHWLDILCSQIARVLRMFRSTAEILFDEFLESTSWAQAPEFAMPVQHV